MSEMSMHLLYVHSTSIGYARYGVKLAEALKKLGVDIDDTLDPSSIPRNLTCWVSTPTHAQGWFKSQHTVLSTMWESMSIPESFREGIHNFDQILVPSEQNLELFSRYHDNVAKVPLGVDSKEWMYRKRQAPTSRFVFLIGGSGPRKGQDLAYQAFRKVFKTWPSSMPVPILQFKSPRPVDYVGERIEHIGGRISDEAERDLYGAAHCYLQPSRGEGWGLQPLQAIAQGCPTILTDAHGHAEFAYLGYGISAKPTKSAYFIYGDAGDWWEPSLDELCEQMEYVYYNYGAACEFAEMTSAAAHRQFTWDKCAERFVKAIGHRHFEREYHGDGTWIKPDIKRFLVRVLIPWACDVAGDQYQFVPGKDYWEIADVKRILYEARHGNELVLDPSCVVLNAETDPTVECGLTLKQLESFGGYSAKAEFCQSCHQKLGSGELEKIAT